MVVAIAVWSVVVAPGEPVPIIPPGDVRITNVALGEELADESARTTVKLMYRTPGASEESDEEDEDEDEEKEDEDVEIETTVLCSLIPGKIEQTSVDVTLEGDEEYLIQAVGRNTVYLTGNYIDQTPTDQVPYDDDSDDEGDYGLDDEDEYDEIDEEDEEMLEEDASRFEEIDDDAQEKKETSKKRFRDSGVSEAGQEKLTKAEKKQNKKLKAEDGKAVPTGAEQPKTNGDVKKDKEKQKKDKGKEKEKEKEKKDEKGAEKKETRDVQGVKITDHKVGTGRQAKAGDTVSMRYIGKLNNGKSFDQNKSGPPFKFRLGAGEVIKGWDIGIAGMQVNGERLIVVPPELGYGKQKMGRIPPNSTLTFEVKLLQIH